MPTHRPYATFGDSGTTLWLSPLRIDRLVVGAAVKTRPPHGAAEWHQATSRGEEAQRWMRTTSLVLLAVCLGTVAPPALGQAHARTTSFEVRLTVMRKLNIVQVRPSADGDEAVIETNSRDIEIGGQRIRFESIGRQTIQLPTRATQQEAPGIVRIIQAY